MDKEQLEKALELAKEVEGMQQNGLHDNEILIARGVLQLAEENENREQEYQVIKKALSLTCTAGKQSEADNAALVQALEEADDALLGSVESRNANERGETRNISVFEAVLFDRCRTVQSKIKESLSTPHPGQALLDELAKLRTLAEAARNFSFILKDEDKRGLSPWIDYQDAKDLNEALAALDSKAGEV